MLVMGPAGVSSGPANPINPPGFSTNKTIKEEYRDVLRTWIQMINQFAHANLKYKAHVSAAGHLVYIACDTTAKEMLKQAEKNKKLTLKCNDQEVMREILVEKISSVISQERPTDAVRAEVDVLSQIISCTCRSEEKPSDFVTRFSGTVAKYCNLTFILTHATSRQFGIFLLRNAGLYTDILNCVTYQLTTATKETSDKGVKVEVHLNSNEVKGISLGLAALRGEHANEILGKVKEGVKVVEYKRTGCNFTIEEAAAVASQEVVTDRKFSSGETTMLAAQVDRMTDPERSQRIHHMKDSTACTACGKRGHWWTENPECKDRIYKKRKLDSA